MISYKDLYSLVVKEIEKRLQAESETSPTFPRSQSTQAQAPFNLNDLVQNVLDGLSQLVKPRIIEGLDVKATTPPSRKVIVNPGKGGVNARFVEITNPQVVEVPFTKKGNYFILLTTSNTIEVDVIKRRDALTLAQIVIPKDSTQYIQDDKPTDGYDGWIISGKDLFWQEDFVFDDYTREKLNKFMKDFLASNLIGEIKLSEKLTISNLAGSMKATSDAITFYDGEGNKLAYYGSDKAEIGKILILPDALQSTNFQAGSSGFRIKSNGKAEFQDVVVRGQLYATSPSGSTGAGFFADSDLNLNGYKILQLGDPDDNQDGANKQYVDDWFKPLRPKAADPPAMYIVVEGSNLDTYHQNVYISGYPLNWSGGNSPVMTAPTSNPRFDLISYSIGDGGLIITEGTEAVAPLIPVCPKGDTIPICVIYHRVGESKIVDYAARNANPGEGYIYRDVRPRFSFDTHPTGIIPGGLFIGRWAGLSNESTGWGNVFLGPSTGQRNTTGKYNLFVGPYSGGYNTTGVSNVFMGYHSGYTNSNGGFNVFIGHQAGYTNSTGDYNVFLGENAGYSNSTGGRNLFLGGEAGYSNSAGAFNIFIGYKAGYNETGSYKLYIEPSDSATPLIYGEFDNDNVGFNTTDMAGGKGVLALANAVTIPSSTPSGGGVIYVEAGALKYKGSSGTVTTLANA